MRVIPTKRSKHLLHTSAKGPRYRDLRPLSRGLTNEALHLASASHDLERTKQRKAVINVTPQVIKPLLAKARTPPGLQ